ncbi:integrase, catalytic region, zinc finger, CCHC-type containing protein, partial [Tanacetum coccineum]
MDTQNDDLKSAGSDTHPLMLDKTDFASWQQCIRFYCQGKDNGINFLKSINEGPFLFPKTRDTVTEGVLRPECDKLLSKLTAAENERESQLYDDFVHFQKKKGEPIYDYYFAGGTQLDTGITLMDDLLNNVTKTIALLSKSYKSHLPQTNNHLRTAFNTSNQATVQNGQVMVQNVQGRQQRGQGNNPRGANVAGNGGVQNRGAAANHSQDNPIKCYNCNRFGHIAKNCTQPKRPQNSDYFKDKMFLMQAQENGVDLAQKRDNIFQADHIDAFDSDIDEAPTAHTMFMANLTSTGPVYDEFGSSYDSDILSEVHEYDIDLDTIGVHHEVQEIPNNVQLCYDVKNNADYMNESNMISYDQYVQNNAAPVVQSKISSVPNDDVLKLINDMHEQAATCHALNEQHRAVNESLIAELARYKEQVNMYEKRARFELTKRKQKIEKEIYGCAMVSNSEETLNLAKKSRQKMLEKVKEGNQSEPKAKLNFGPPDYLKANYLETFIPKKKLTPEQLYWSKDLADIAKEKALKQSTEKPKTTLTMYPPNTPTKIVPKFIQTKSQVKIIIYTTIQLFKDFELTCKKRITPTGLTEGKRGFEKTKECYLTEIISFFNTIKQHFEETHINLTKEIKEMKDVFEQMEKEVEQNDVDKRCAEIERKNLLIENENLIATLEQARVVQLEAEISKLKQKIEKDDHNEIIKSFSKPKIDHLDLQLKYNNLKSCFKQTNFQSPKDAPEFDSLFKITQLEEKLQAKDNTIKKLKTHISRINEPNGQDETLIELNKQQDQLYKRANEIKELTKLISQ